MSFSQPSTNIAHLQLTHGMSVADIGCGSGHYTFEASRVVGNDGSVYAVDVQKNLLDKIAKEAESQHIKNIHVLWGDAETVGGTRLRADSVDAVVASNVLFQTESKSSFVHEMKRILKKNGKIMLIDWSESFTGMGPDSLHVVSDTIARKLFEDNGFTVEKVFDAGLHHYGFIFSNSVVE